tara:strand:+ start:152 stop:415 length:264 start_codon:yes stop_codon:yes gene_type:complete
MKSLMGHRRPPRGFSRIEDKEKRVYFHVLQVDPKDSYGWFDEMISRDYGKVYKEKLLLEKDVPEYRYRIVVKSSTKNWKEIKDAFER